MKTQDLDNELKSLIKGIKLDSPGIDFTSKVMNRVLEEKSALEQVKNERILGKGFWIILALFVLLIVSMFVFSGSGIQEEGQLSKMFNSVSDGSLLGSYKSVEEIGEIAKMTESNVKVKLFRARKKLYTILNDMLKEELYTIL